MIINIGRNMQALANKELWEGVWKNSNVDAASTYDIYIAGQVRGKNLLDIGCGDARYSILPKNAARYVGIDFSMEALRQAKKNHKNAKEADFICAAAEHLPFKENSFDKVVAVQTATLLGRSLPAALKEARRVTKDEVCFDINHDEYELARYGCGAKLDCGTLIRHGNLEIICFSDEAVIRLLETSNLSPRSIQVMTDEERRNLDVSIFERMPGDDTKAWIIVTATKK